MSVQNKLLIGKDKNINEQLIILEKILRKNKKIMKILTILQEYAKEKDDFKSHYLAAGCINQTIFNYYHNYEIDYGIEDYDIVYYDEDTSYDKEDIIIKDLMKKLSKLNLEFDIKNENRVPIWYKEKYGVERKKYTNVENAISRWGTTITCIGVRLENNELKVVCPYGLNDLFSLIIRPVKIDFTKADYEKKVKKWKEKWSNLSIINWDN